MPANVVSIEVFADQYIRTFGGARDDNGLCHFWAVMAVSLQKLPVLKFKFRLLLYSKQVQRGRRLLVRVHCVLKYVIVHLADRRGTRMKINSLIFDY